MNDRFGLLFVLSFLALACANGNSNDQAGPGGHAGVSAGGTGSTGAGGSGGGSAVVPQIRLNDAHPVLNDTEATVYLTLSPAASKTVTVDFATADDSAKSASGDYVPVKKTLTFPAGTTQLSVPVKVTTPYKTLTLDTALDRAFKTQLSNPSGATIADGDGVVTLAHAGMVIETPLAAQLSDGDIVPDFNGDKRADLALTGSGGKGALLLTPGSVFEEAGHIVVDDAYLDGERAFSWEVKVGLLVSLEVGAFAGDRSMVTDQNADGLTDLLILGENKIHLLYGHTGPFFNFESQDTRLADGKFATHFSKLAFVHGSNSIQTADYDGDGVLDFGQAGSYSSAEGGTDYFQGFYGASGQYAATYETSDAFAFQSGTTPVGQASLTSGCRPGVRADLNGDQLDDLVFVGLAHNDGIFGGNYLYVRFGDGKRMTGTLGVNGTLDGTNGFQVSNHYPSNWSSFVPQDAGDVNGDGVDDLVVLGGGTDLTVIFGRKTPFSSGSYPTLADLGSDAALFETDPVKSARIGDLNRDGIGDIVFISENKLRIVWGKKDLKGQAIFGTQYPEFGEVDIDPASGLDSVGVVGDLDGDDTADIVIFSSSFHEKTGAALIVFGSTLTRSLGGPDLDIPIPH